jgi:hypothetical protein
MKNGKSKKVGGHIACVLVLLFLSSCTGPQVNQRYFKEPNGKQTWNALNCLSCEGAYANLIEVNENKKPITGDTISVWVQHFKERGVSKIQREATSADLIVSCYPNRINDPNLTEKHVFPDHDGIVCVTWMKNGYVIVTKPTTNSCKNLNYPSSFDKIKN